MNLMIAPLFQRNVAALSIIFLIKKEDVCTSTCVYKLWKVLFFYLYETKVNSIRLRKLKTYVQHFDGYFTIIFF